MKRKEVQTTQTKPILLYGRQHEYGHLRKDGKRLANRRIRRALSSLSQAWVTKVTSSKSDDDISTIP